MTEWSLLFLSNDNLSTCSPNKLTSQLINFFTEQGGGWYSRAHTHALHNKVINPFRFHLPSSGGERGMAGVAAAIPKNKWVWRRHTKFWQIATAKMGMAALNKWYDDQKLFRLSAGFILIPNRFLFYFVKY